MRAHSFSPFFAIRPKRAAIILVLVFLLAGFIVPLIPAHGTSYSPTFIQPGSPFGTATSITATTAVIAPTAFETLSGVTAVILVFCNETSASSVADTYGLTWTLGGAWTQGPITGVSTSPSKVWNGFYQLWYAQAVSTTPGIADTITFTVGSALSHTASFAYIDGYITSLMTPFQTAVSLLDTQAAGTSFTWGPNFNSAIPANSLVLEGVEVGFGSPVNTGLSAATLTGAGGFTNSVPGGAFVGQTYVHTTPNFYFANEAGIMWNFYATAQTISTTSVGSLTSTSSGTQWSAVSFLIIFNPGAPSASGSTANITIGSCPAKNTATTTLVNNTEYFYTSSALSGSSINLVNTFIAQVTSATAPQTLSLGIYATLNAGPVSASNTFFLIAAFSKSLSAGTTNNGISWSPGVGLSSTLVGNIPTGATIGVALLGTNKIKINQSSLAGMSTGSTSGGVLASTFTAISSNAAQLYLCMMLSYQTVITSTTTATSTTTTTSGVTTTVSALSNPALFNSNFMLAIIVILGPSLILAAATKSLWGGILGALLGGAAGAFIGFLPFWVPVVIVVGCITVLFFARGGGGDKM